VLEALREDGLDVTGTHLDGASGLAHGTHVTPALLVATLRLDTDPAHPRLRGVAVDLPISGLSGTLSDRFTTSPARGLVRAKTGSLTAVTSLAGTVQDADGRLLVFAVIADHVPTTGETAAREAVDEFVTQLAGCGCHD
jgi:D-alanyl-D-alanine carboxypeptidase/D-alanyl-D-alanine-endopeptidase (penicillin-binding protein 4)